MRWWGVMGLGVMFVAGCQAIPTRFSAGKLGQGHAVQEAERTSENTRPRFDPGLIRTQFEREEKPSQAPAPVPAPEAKVPPEQSISVHLDMGRMLEAQGRAEEALGEYRKAIDAYREAGNRIRGNSEARARLYRKMAQAFDRLARPDEARTHYQTAQKLAPRDPNVWNDSGYSALIHGRFDEAERLLKKAAALDPANPRILTNLGMTLAASGQINPALEILTRAGGPVSARMNVAYVLASTGRPDEARQHYQAALSLDPNLVLAHSALKKLGPETPTQTAQAPVPARSRSSRAVSAR